MILIRRGIFPGVTAGTIVLFLFSLFLRYKITANRHLILNRYDMFAITSRFWLSSCSEVKVRPVYPGTDSEFSVFSTPHLRHLDSPKKQLFDVDYLDIKSGTFKFIQLHLIQGSKLKIHYHVNRGFITFMVIKSVYNFNKWKENIHGICKDCCLKIHYSSTVDGRELQTATADVTDNYYIIFLDNPKLSRRGSEVHASVTLDRIEYSLTNAEGFCSAKRTTCKVWIPWSSEALIISAGNNSNTLEISLKCYLRVEFVLSFIFIMFIKSTVMISLLWSCRTFRKVFVMESVFAKTKDI